MRLILAPSAGAAPGAADGDLDDLDDLALAELYAYPGNGPWLRANMVSTLDGAATGPDGRTGSINNEADKRVFSLLRALSDVIVVGAGTARAEGYRHPGPVTGARAVLREGRPPAPALVVVSRTGNLPLGLAGVPEVEGSGQVLLATSEAAEERALDTARETLGESQVLVLGEDGVDQAALVEHLVDRGLPRMLTEGGPQLLRDMVAAGVLDELCLTVVPHLLAGEHPRILTGEGVAASMSPRMLLEAEGTLLGRWTRDS
jgi:riboflavin biosynthesis pyrimidine reductase